jgi:hypothetical protein
MVDPENFEVTLRLFGTEVVAFKLTSQSSRKMWVVVGTIVSMVVVLIVKEAMPVIQQLL